MDEPLLTAEQETFRCPGETYTIDRAVHLARLAVFYPACRQCVCRVDARFLPPAEARHWAQLERRAERGARFTSEGFEGSAPGDVDPPLAARFAGALARVLWLRHDQRRAPPAVLVANDAHWTTAELVAAACERLRLDGCRAVEAGSASSASLAFAAHRLEVQAALWIGNATGAPHATGLRLWGSRGQPWSTPGDLEAVRSQFESPAESRPQRRGGSLERVNGEADYLQPLASLFHGLRPLRFVLDTACEPLVRQLRGLVSRGACEVLRPQTADAVGWGISSSTERAPRRRQEVCSTPPEADRLARLGQSVLAEAAHFGLWIGGDGQSCRAVDERGVAIHAERLFLTLAQYVCSQQAGAVLAVERTATSDLRRALGGLSERVVPSDATRQAMYETMLAQRAVFGGGPSGRLWFAGEPPAPDALIALCLLLTMLSQSDRAASEVLDAA